MDKQVYVLEKHNVMLVAEIDNLREHLEDRDL